MTMETMRLFCPRCRRLTPFGNSKEIEKILRKDISGHHRGE